MVMPLLNLHRAIAFPSTLLIIHNWVNNSLPRILQRLTPFAWKLKFTFSHIWSGHARMFIADKSPSLSKTLLPLIVLRSILFSHSIVKYHKFNLIVWLSKLLFFLSLIDAQLVSYYITLVHPDNFIDLPPTQHGCCNLSLNPPLLWLILELLFPYLHTQLG